MVTSLHRDGWCPIRLKWLGGQAFVDWCYLDERFTEPFFDQTILSAMKRPFNALFTHRTSIHELGHLHAESPGLDPTGFIFHMSRCGSTLISRTLAEFPENVVISEAYPLDWLARAQWIPESVRADWLRWMVSALGQKRFGNEERYFIKFDAPTVMTLPFIRRVFPQVPWIFIYREPGEVLTSHMRESAAAMTPGVIMDLAVIDGSVQETLNMLPEEYAARVLGRICEAALRGLDDSGLLINYAQLPQAVTLEIARHFGVAFSEQELATARTVALQNAKHPQRRFEPDGEKKRSELTGSGQAAVAQWIQPFYDELERLRGVQ